MRQVSGFSKGYKTAACIGMSRHDSAMKAKTAFLNLFFLVGIMTFLPNSVCAKVTGPCVNCHTMHNSQGGEGVVTGDPLRHLLGDTCIGCHTGANNGSNTIPFVYAAAEPTYGTDTLAGGNFYWVATVGEGNDTKGHNVLGLSAEDANFSEAPGNPNHCANSCHYSLATTDYNAPGCYGCHLSPAHHADDSDIVVGSDEHDTDGYYRFLSGHNSGDGHGVAGIEADDWEYNPSPTDHNEYLGWVGDHHFSAGFYNLGHTMTAFCCGCHGEFHIQQDDGGAWIRHPSDAALPDTYEYTIYDPLAPVARPNLSSYSGPSGVVTPGTDLVMCLSCHRAHGSPYASMLRWSGSEDEDGCKICHTTND